jgi:exodeoxyribonuclease V
MSWSPQQDAALKAVRAWLRQRQAPQVFRLFGYAGTGKTTLAKELAEGLKGTVLYGAFTGKAALVLRRKGCTGASTIHSMIYQVDDEQEGWQPSFKLNQLSPVREASLVIIDECSMVDEELGKDLLSFGTPVLVLGDPAQLPPVRGAGFFTSAKPDVMLTEVHRQARDNPIIAMSMTIREGGRWERGTYGSSRVVARADIDAPQILAADQVLVGLNKTRRSFNARIRELRGRDPALPEAGDRLVCLRNNKEKKLLNGGLWEVEEVKAADRQAVRMLARSDDHIEAEPTDIYVLRGFFDGREDDIPWDERRGTDEFTYGYALTCHKAQGSQWNDVVLFDESSSFPDCRAQHLYTAVTRAAERITVVQRS